jgi:hypothetical protein
MLVEVQYTAAKQNLSRLNTDRIHWSSLDFRNFISDSTCSSSSRSRRDAVNIKSRYALALSSSRPPELTIQHCSSISNHHKFTNSSRLSLATSFEHSSFVNCTFLRRLVCHSSVSVQAWTATNKIRQLSTPNTRLLYPTKLHHG